MHESFITKARKGAQSRKPKFANPAGNQNGVCHMHYLPSGFAHFVLSRLNATCEGSRWLF